MLSFKRKQVFPDCRRGGHRKVPPSGHSCPETAPWEGRLRSPPKESIRGNAFLYRGSNFFPIAAVGAAGKYRPQAIRVRKQPLGGAGSGRRQRKALGVNVDYSRSETNILKQGLALRSKFQPFRAALVLSGSVTKNKVEKTSLVTGKRRPPTSPLNLRKSHHRFSPLSRSFFLARSSTMRPEPNLPPEEGPAAAAGRRQALPRGASAGFAWRAAFASVLLAESVSTSGASAAKQKVASNSPT